MDYEQKYKEALERAKQFSEHPHLEDSGGIVEYIFPELKESEDERIRKALIKTLKCDEAEKCLNSFGINIFAAIAWLEKQGEQKWTGGDEAHLHSITMHLEQWIERHPNTCGADIQWENIAWLKSLKQRNL